MVKQLRDATSAGMMDCKRALQETDGDFDAAVKLLREKGMASAAKRADRETTEGIVLTQADDDARHDRRGRLRDRARLEERRLPSRSRRTCSARCTSAGRRPSTCSRSSRAELAARLGENIQIVGARRIAAGHGETLVSYVHPPAKKVGVLVDTQAAARPSSPRELAMHIAFARPTYRTRDQVPTELVEAEREILEKLPEVRVEAGRTCARRSSRAC